MEKINTFKELLNEIAWSWQYPVYDIWMDPTDFSLNLNKLNIREGLASYKTERYELAPGVYDQAVRFYEFLKSTENK